MYIVCLKTQNVAIELKAMSNYLLVVLFVTIQSGSNCSHSNGSRLQQYFPV